MADDTEETKEITTETVAESLGLSDDQRDESNGEQLGNDDGQGDHGDGEADGQGNSDDGGNDEQEEQNEQNEDGAAGGDDKGDQEDEAASGGEDEGGEEGGEGESGGDGEGDEVTVTPEHQVGAGIQKFLADNVPAERLQEGMESFQNAMQIISHQMNGDYEGYWQGMTPSLEQAAIDNPDVFIDTLAPLYEKVLYGAGRMLTPENRRAVDNMEISEEMALKMQKNEHKLSISQRNIDMFNTQKDTDAQRNDVERQNNEASLAVRETLERFESQYPNVKGLREHVAKELADVVPESADHARLVVENVVLKMVNDNSQKNGQREKKPLRSNKTAASSVPKNNPDTPHSADEVAQSLGVA